MGGYPTQLRFATRDPDSFHEESGIRSYNRICYRPEPTSTLEKHTSGQTMHVHAQHVHALEVCAVGIRKRAYQELTEHGRSHPGRVRLPTFGRQGFMTPFKEAKPA